MVRALAAAGADLADVGIIAPYRSQVRAIRAALDAATASSSSGGGADLSSVELNTADKFQGRDKGTVLVSFTRSNAQGRVGELLRDRRRVNVMLSRAKAALVLVGSARTLERGCDVLAALVAAVRRRGWLVELPPDALSAAAQ
ncbi:AAA domain-containing protein [Tribonema minus]|uniref:DNA replication ATP-dependent helicase/nuclease n=1 Tax=Tribonema minus TaxID=303371 RepID=A0A836CIM7_9STRA|nr:AAA domain-containing protein [Tribonema minus]